MPIVYQADIKADLSFPSVSHRHVAEFEAETVLRIDFTHWPHGDDDHGVDVRRVVLRSEADEVELDRRTLSILFPSNELWDVDLPGLILDYHNAGQSRRIGVESANPIAA